MHFLLLLVRLVLDRLFPTWRDSLMMAVRPDGRIEHVPTRPSLWDRWLSLWEPDSRGDRASRHKRQRGKVRAGLGKNDGDMRPPG